jgi:hypothetical protein
MIKGPKAIGFAVSIALIVLLHACNTDDKNDENTSTPATTTDSPATVPGKEIALTGTLTNLFIETTEFVKLTNERKLVFSFTFRTDTLTLWGWQCKNKDCDQTAFDNAPALKLTKGAVTTVTYGPNVIFGNVVIYKKDIKTIKDKIDGKYTYVVFVPSLDGEFIKYKLYATNDDPKTLNPAQILALVDLGVDANPSPPKNN